MTQMDGIAPADGMSLVADTRLKPGVYVLPNGLSLDRDGITLDGNGATLVGVGRQNRGIRLKGRKGVAIRNVCLRDYRHGIHAVDCSELRIEKNQITSTAEIAANTIFLDIWLKADAAYGGGILLERVRTSTIEGNDLQHQCCGLLSYFCERLNVCRNNASYCSGYGVHLYGTSDSVFEENYADYCCRYEPRGPGIGHMGADATGFLIVHGSCRNVFRNNFARLGGDGFFLAGLTPEGVETPCNDNLFEGNDGSLSPNIAFEATFSQKNTFRNNKAERCNFGFWLGFSSDNVLEDNRMVMNRQAGIAVENGARFTVRGNQFQRNGAGVLLWSKFAEPWFEKFPGNRTCHHWLIEKNTFTRNDTGVAILADKDHGIRPMPPEACGRAETRPHDNVVRGNDIQDNRVGIDLYRTDRTTVEGNILNRNVECNIRRDDDGEALIRNNLGAAGAYL